MKVIENERKCYPLQEYGVKMKQLQNTVVSQRNGRVPTPNILARKSEEG
jgi:hypothetical protein